MHSPGRPVDRGCTPRMAVPSVHALDLGLALFELRSLVRAA
jgi:hypothetical protein